MQSARLLPWTLLAFLGIAAHGASLPNPFVFDDVDAIVNHASKLWPPAAAFGAPAGSGASGRPLTAFSIAIDRTLFGLRPAGWHAVNIGLLVFLSWALYALVRGTLRGVNAGGVALAAAALWVVHPLHSAVIDHVVYRNELLAGLFVAVMLLCLRRAHAPDAGARWSVAAVLACGAAMASKEMAAAAPLIALLYDALFLSGSYRAALGRRWLYLGLASTWLVLFACLASGDRGASVTERFADVSRFDYARTQLGVVAHYLRLAFVPRPLVLDYDWPIARSWNEVAGPALLVVALLAATVLALLRRRGIGFLGAAFFLLLAPSSSIIPLTGAVAGEHRMCVPLICVVVAVVLAFAAFLARPALMGARRWIGIGATSITVLLLASMAVARHRDFATTVGIWADTAGKAPRNPRAHGNWGAALLAAGRPAEAIPPLTHALELQPAFSAARQNLAGAQRTLGFQYASRGATDSALVHLRPAVQLAPDDFASENALAWILATSPDSTLRDPTAALQHAQHAEKRAPANFRAEILDTLAAALAATGDFESAQATALAAHESAVQRGDRDLAAQIAARAAEYAVRRPVREVRGAAR